MVDSFNIIVPIDQSDKLFGLFFLVMHQVVFWGLVGKNKKEHNRLDN